MRRRLPRILLNAATAVSLVLWFANLFWPAPRPIFTAPDDGGLMPYEIVRGTFYDVRFTPGLGREYVRTTLLRAILMPLFAVLPTWWVIARLRGATRSRRGLCSVCGYDLRATPTRCPECGLVPARTIP